MFLVTVQNNDGDSDSIGTITEGIYTSEEKAFHALANWCKSQWLNQEHEGEDSDGIEELQGTDREVVAEYFEFWEPEETYSLEEVELDAPLPGTEA